MLNSLLFRRSFLITTTVKAYYKTIMKNFQCRRKISTEYVNEAQIITPFENMLDLINYNASKYTCEGDNYVVTIDFRYPLYEHLSNRKNEEENELEFPNLHVVAKWLHRPEQPKIKKLKFKNRDNIIDNLQAILKSEEIFFKNNVKLIKVFEKDEILRDDAKLEKLKIKLTACIDVLSNKRHTECSNLLNILIEEELARFKFICRGRKTNSKIDQKAQKPVVIEAPKNNDVRIEETSCQVKEEIQVKEEDLMKAQSVNVEEKTSSPKQEK